MSALSDKLEHMFEQFEELDANTALACAVDRRRAADRAEAELLGIAAHWADLHPVVEGDPDGFRVPGMEKLVSLAGAGTPEVAEFAPAELGTALGISTYAAQLLVGDSLELRHRLPRLWARIQAGSLQAWRGRQIAERTRSLSVEAASWVDAQVAPFAHKIALRRIIDAVEAALIRFDPEAAAKKAREASDGRGVWIDDEMTDGTRSIRIQADALDAAAFDDTIDRIADALAGLGDDERKDIRRAKAVGTIADPQGTLDLLSTKSAADGDAQGTENGDGSGTGPAVPSYVTDRHTGSARASGKPRLTLYVHLHEDAITAGGGVGRVEGLGSVTVEQIRDWVGRSDVVVKPVLDLNDTASVDAYEVPDRMGETVLLRNPCCPFPWCSNLSRNKDMDHIEEYVPPGEGGPPGQTAAHKLGPLCRRHHRLKTHGGWTYTMSEPGIYLWRSPRGRRYLVDHTGTSALPLPA